MDDKNGVGGAHGVVNLKNNSERDKGTNIGSDMADSKLQALWNPESTKKSTFSILSYLIFNF